MAKKKQQEEEKEIQINENSQLLRKQTIKELIAPSGIDASDIDHLEIISSVKNMQEVSLFQHYQECVHFLNCLEICIFLEI